MLDLFAVPEAVEPLPGGQGRSVRAGDLVLSPDRDPDVLVWLNPALARLAVRLDERPGRSLRDLRIAMPVPARDGSWSVGGWGASRFEPGTVACDDLAVLAATAHVLHAELAVAVPQRPDGLDDREDRWARAERQAFGEQPLITAAGPGATLAARLHEALRPVDLGPDQLVHADLAGNVLLDAYGAPVVIDVAPAWRPVRWAEAVCALDAVMWFGAPLDALSAWSQGVPRQAILRAALFRVLADALDVDVAAYERALGPVLVAGPGGG
ncbi:hypothetical protein NPS01_16320 [Nocardioides psychrotolerans]|uniref:TIGR02569 family protein n=1 Tax=Nocardioides psychrotolerans TaxID=1005945 RepID=A0A1I3RKK7_9ACTN|nr:hypothetical protein NPS01_16320 [Nocardioides psychrotolerans]SFJ47123.1 TIGR02569 family protein [Nocardioides psychrotolerans]